MAVMNFSSVSSISWRPGPTTEDLGGTGVRLGVLDWSGVAPAADEVGVNTGVCSVVAAPRGVVEPAAEDVEDTGVRKGVLEWSGVASAADGVGVTIGVCSDAAAARGVEEPEAEDVSGTVVRKGVLE